MAEASSVARLKLRYLVPDLQEPAACGPNAMHRIEAAARVRLENVLYWKVDIRREAPSGGEAPSESDGAKESAMAALRWATYGKYTNSAVGSAADAASVALKKGRKSMLGLVTGKKDHK